MTIDPQLQDVAGSGGGGETGGGVGVCEGGEEDVDVDAPEGFERGKSLVLVEEELDEGGCVCLRSREVSYSSNKSALERQCP